VLWACVVALQPNTTKPVSRQLNRLENLLQQVAIKHGCGVDVMIFDSGHQALASTYFAFWFDLKLFFKISRFNDEAQY